MKTSSSPADSIDPGNDSRRRGHEYHQESDGKYSFAAQLVHLQHPILKNVYNKSQVYNPGGLLCQTRKEYVRRSLPF